MENRALRTSYKIILPILIIFAIGWSAAGVLAVGNLRASGSEDAYPGEILEPLAQATYILAAPDATATPTPFQPLAPTSLASPTGAATEASNLPTAFAPTVTLQPTPLAVLTAAPAIEKLPSQINLLLLGSDRRPWDAGFRTDTIILVTINSEHGNVNITSFPRDLWVMLPNWGMSRINTAWTYGGWNMMRDTFKHNFGVNIDYHILVDFSSFKKIVDGLGGLDIKVSESVSDYRAGYWVTIKKGLQHMDADTVLWYSRTRKTTNDIARNRRQQEVLTALLEKFISIDAIRRAPELYDLYNNSVKTDITLVDVLRWLPFAAKFIETRDMRQYFITYKEVYDWITPEGAMVLVPNKEALMKVIRRSQNLQ